MYRGRMVWILRVPGRCVASHTIEATRVTMCRLVRTRTVFRVRAERIGAPVAIGRLVTLANLQAIDSSCAPLEGRCTCTGLSGIGSQLL